MNKYEKAKQYLQGTLDSAARYGDEYGVNQPGIHETRIAIEALEKIERLREDLKYYLNAHEENGVVYIPKFVVQKRIKELETHNEYVADIDKVKYGFWEQGDFYDYGDVCSECQYDSCMETCEYNYCPNCGAKMSK